MSGRGKAGKKKNTSVHDIASVTSSATSITSIIETIKAAKTSLATAAQSKSSVSSEKLETQWHSLYDEFNSKENSTRRRTYILTCIRELSPNTPQTIYNQFSTSDLNLFLSAMTWKHWQLHTTGNLNQIHEVTLNLLEQFHINPKQMQKMLTSMGQLINDPRKSVILTPEELLNFEKIFGEFLITACKSEFKAILDQHEKLKKEAKECREEIERKKRYSGSGQKNSGEAQRRLIEISKQQTILLVKAGVTTASQLNDTWFSNKCEQLDNDRRTRGNTIAAFALLEHNPKYKTLHDLFPTEMPNARTSQSYLLSGEGDGEMIADLSTGEILQKDQNDDAISALTEDSAFKKAKAKKTPKIPVTLLHTASPVLSSSTTTKINNTANNPPPTILSPPKIPATLFSAGKTTSSSALKMMQRKAQEQQHNDTPQKTSVSSSVLSNELSPLPPDSFRLTDNERTQINQIKEGLPKEGFILAEKFNLFQLYASMGIRTAEEMWNELDSIVNTTDPSKLDLRNRVCDILGNISSISSIVQTKKGDARLAIFSNYIRRVRNDNKWPDPAVLKAFACAKSFNLYLWEVAPESMSEDNQPSLIRISSQESNPRSQHRCDLLLSGVYFKVIKFSYSIEKFNEQLRTTSVIARAGFDKTVRNESLKRSNNERTVEERLSHLQQRIAEPNTQHSALEAAKNKAQEIREAITEQQVQQYLALVGEWNSICRSLSQQDKCLAPEGLSNEKILVELLAKYNNLSINNVGKLSEKLCAYIHQLTGELNSLNLQKAINDAYPLTDFLKTADEKRAGNAAATEKRHQFVQQKTTEIENAIAQMWVDFIRLTRDSLSEAERKKLDNAVWCATGNEQKLNALIQNERFANVYIGLQNLSGSSEIISLFKSKIGSLLSEMSKMGLAEYERVVELRKQEEKRRQEDHEKELERDLLEQWAKWLKFINKTSYVQPKNFKELIQQVSDCIDQITKAITAFDNTRKQNAAENFMYCINAFIKTAELEYVGWTIPPTLVGSMLLSSMELKINRMRESERYGFYEEIISKDDIVERLRVIASKITEDKIKEKIDILCIDYTKGALQAAFKAALLNNTEIFNLLNKKKHVESTDNISSNMGIDISASATFVPPQQSLPLKTVPLVATEHVEATIQLDLDEEIKKIDRTQLSQKDNELLTLILQAKSNLQPTISTHKQGKKDADEKCLKDMLRLYHIVCLNKQQTGNTNIVVKLSESTILALQVKLITVYKQEDIEACLKAIQAHPDIADTEPKIEDLILKIRKISEADKQPFSFTYEVKAHVVNQGGRQGDLKSVTRSNVASDTMNEEIINRNSDLKRVYEFIVQKIHAEQRLGQTWKPEFSTFLTAVETLSPQSLVMEKSLGAFCKAIQAYIGRGNLGYRNYIGSLSGDEQKALVESVYAAIQTKMQEIKVEFAQNDADEPLEPPPLDDDEESINDSDDDEELFEEEEDEPEGDPEDDDEPPTDDEEDLPLPPDEMEQLIAAIMSEINKNDNIAQFAGLVSDFRRIDEQPEFDAKAFFQSIVSCLRNTGATNILPAIEALIDADRLIVGTRISEKISAMLEEADEEQDEVLLGEEFKQKQNVTQSTKLDIEPPLYTPPPTSSASKKDSTKKEPPPKPKAQQKFNTSKANAFPNMRTGSQPNFGTRHSNLPPKHSQYVPPPKAPALPQEWMAFVGLSLEYFLSGQTIQDIFIVLIKQWKKEALLRCIQQWMQLDLATIQTILERDFGLSGSIDALKLEQLRGSAIILLFLAVLKREPQNVELKDILASRWHFYSEYSKLYILLGVDNFINELSEFDLPEQSSAGFDASDSIKALNCFQILMKQYNVSREQYQFFKDEINSAAEQKEQGYVEEIPDVVIEAARDIEQEEIQEKILGEDTSKPKKNKKGFFKAFKGVFSNFFSGFSKQKPKTTDNSSTSSDEDSVLIDPTIIEAIEATKIGLNNSQGQDEEEDEYEEVEVDSEWNFDTMGTDGIIEQKDANQGILISSDVNAQLLLQQKNTLFSEWAEIEVSIAQAEKTQRVLESLMLELIAKREELNNVGGIEVKLEDTVVSVSLEQLQASINSILSKKPSPDSFVDTEIESYLIDLVKAQKLLETVEKNLAKTQLALETENTQLDEQLRRIAAEKKAQEEMMEHDVNIGYEESRVVNTVDVFSPPTPTDEILVEITQDNSEKIEALATLIEQYEALEETFKRIRGDFLASKDIIVEKISSVMTMIQFCNSLLENNVNTGSIIERTGMFIKELLFIKHALSSLLETPSNRIGQDCFAEIKDIAYREAVLEEWIEKLKAAYQEVEYDSLDEVIEKNQGYIEEKQLIQKSLVQKFDSISTAFSAHQLQFEQLKAEFAEFSQHNLIYQTMLTQLQKREKGAEETPEEKGALDVLLVRAFILALHGYQKETDSFTEGTLLKFKNLFIQYIESLSHISAEIKANVNQLSNENVQSFLPIVFNYINSSNLITLFEKNPLTSDEWLSLFQFRQILESIHDSDDMKSSIVLAIKSFIQTFIHEDPPKEAFSQFFAEFDRDGGYKDIKQFKAFILSKLHLNIYENLLQKLKPANTDHGLSYNVPLIELTVEAIKQKIQTSDVGFSDSFVGLLTANVGKSHDELKSDSATSDRLMRGFLRYYGLKKGEINAIDLGVFSVSNIQALLDSATEKLGITTKIPSPSPVIDNILVQEEVDYQQLVLDIRAKIRHESNIKPLLDIIDESTNYRASANVTDEDYIQQVMRSVLRYFGLTDEEIQNIDTTLFSMDDVNNILSAINNSLLEKTFPIIQQLYNFTLDCIGKKRVVPEALQAIVRVSADRTGEISREMHLEVLHALVLNEPSFISEDEWHMLSLIKYDEEDSIAQLSNAILASARSEMKPKVDYKQLVLAIQNKIHFASTISPLLLDMIDVSNDFTPKTSVTDYVDTVMYNFLTYLELNDEEIQNIDTTLFSIDDVNNILSAINSKLLEEIRFIIMRLTNYHEELILSRSVPDALRDIATKSLDNTREMHLQVIQALISDKPDVISENEWRMLSLVKYKEEDKIEALSNGILDITRLSVRPKVRSVVPLTRITVEPPQTNSIVIAGNAREKDPNLETLLLELETLKQQIQALQLSNERLQAQLSHDAQNSTSRDPVVVVLPAPEAVTQEDICALREALQCLAEENELLRQEQLNNNRDSLELGRLREQALSLSYQNQRLVEENHRVSFSRDSQSSISVTNTHNLQRSSTISTNSSVDVSYSKDIFRKLQRLELSGKTITGQQNILRVLHKTFLSSITHSPLGGMLKDLVKEFWPNRMKDKENESRTITMMRELSRALSMSCTPETIKLAKDMEGEVSTLLAYMSQRQNAFAQAEIILDEAESDAYVQTEHQSLYEDKRRKYDDLIALWAKKYGSLDKSVSEKNMDKNTLLDDYTKFDAEPKEVAKLVQKLLIQIKLAAHHQMTISDKTMRDPRESVRLDRQRWSSGEWETWRKDEWSKVDADFGVKEMRTSFVEEPSYQIEENSRISRLPTTDGILVKTGYVHVEPTDSTPKMISAYADKSTNATMHMEGKFFGDSTNSRVRQAQASEILDMVTTALNGYIARNKGNWPSSGHKIIIEHSDERSKKYIVGALLCLGVHYSAIGGVYANEPTYIQEKPAEKSFYSRIMGGGSSQSTSKEIDAKNSPMVKEFIADLIDGLPPSAAFVKKLDQKNNEITPNDYKTPKDIALIAEAIAEVIEARDNVINLRNLGSSRTPQKLIHQATDKVRERVKIIPGQ